LIERLDEFRAKLRQLQNVVYEIVGGHGYPDTRMAYHALKEELQRLYGGLRRAIQEHGELSVVRVESIERDALSFVLSQTEPTEGTMTALEGALASVNMAIGNLEALRTPLRNQVEIEVSERPKAFIAHGGHSARLMKLREFLQALGVEPVAAEWRATEGRWVEEHVDSLMDGCDCCIVLAEYGGIVDKKTGARHPRLNVVDELGRSRQRRPGRTILLLEKGVELPSNVEGIVYEHFAKRSMDKAFIKVARELVAFGLLKAVKG